MTCTTCHDPHKNNEGAGYGMRTLKNTDTAALCATCHAGSNFVTKKGKDGAINPHTAKLYGEGVPEELWREDGKWPWE
jgi:predicted CXXCH cytochrome family protein